MNPKCLWLAAITVVSLITRAAAANDPQYELEGGIDATMSLAQGNVKSFDHIRFHVYVKQCAWLIHAIPEGENGFFSRYLDFWEFGCDGTNQFRLAINKGGGKESDWLGAVYSDIAPTFNLEPHIPVLWFAVASSCYLESADDSLIPVYSTQTSVEPVQAVVQRSRTSPFLPLEAAFFFPGYVKGFTNATYRVLETMPVGDLLVPKRFELKTFRREGNGLEVELECSGNIQSAKPGCSRDDFRPQLPGGTKEIKDYRFVSAAAESKHEFRYKSERWLDSSEVQKLPGYKDYVRWEPMVSKVPSVMVQNVTPRYESDGGIRRAVWVISILSVLATVFALFVVATVFFLLRRQRLGKLATPKDN